MGTGRDASRRTLLELPPERLVDLLLAQTRDLWTVDGLYFLGIEERYGTEVAADVDRQVWEAMGRIEASRLRRALGLEGNDLATMLTALRHTSWMLDLEHKELDVEDDRAVLRIRSCRTQLTRRDKGLGEFPCKPVRHGYLTAFAGAFSPDIEVRCLQCPPGEHDDNLWCAWEFVRR